MTNDQINALLDRVEYLVSSGKMSPKDFAEKMLDHLELLLSSGKMSPKDLQKLRVFLLLAHLIGENVTPNSPLGEHCGG
jgi:hypothetical protein